MIPCSVDLHGITPNSKSVKNVTCKYVTMIFIFQRSCFYPTMQSTVCLDADITAIACVSVSLRHRNHMCVCQFCTSYTLSGRIRKVVASHAEVARSIPGWAETAPIYTIREAQREYCHEGGRCDQSIGSTVSDANVRSWLWLTATRSSPLGYFSRLLQVVDNLHYILWCRFSTGRLLAIELFIFLTSAQSLVCQCPDATTTACVCVCPYVTAIACVSVSLRHCNRLCVCILTSPQSPVCLCPNVTAIAFICVLTSSQSNY